jgi:hypothetical protein
MYNVYAFVPLRETNSFHQSAAPKLDIAEFHPMTKL